MISEYGLKGKNIIVTGAAGGLGRSIAESFASCGANILLTDIHSKEKALNNISKNNIKKIECLGKKLDPNFHQAMIEIEDNTKEPGIIIQEIQKGFTMKDRLLRPSLVGVSKKASDNSKNDEKIKENPEKK